MKILAKKLSITVVTISFATSSLSWAASHRETPLITDRDTINTTDVYSFTYQSNDETSKKPLGTIQNQRPGMTIGDVNGDKIPDVVISNSDKVSVFIGNGDGTFDDQIDTPKTSGAIPTTGANFLQVVE